MPELGAVIVEVLVAPGVHIVGLAADDPALLHADGAAAIGLDQRSVLVQRVERVAGLEVLDVIRRVHIVGSLSVQLAIPVVVLGAVPRVHVVAETVDRRGHGLGRVVARPAGDFRERVIGSAPAQRQLIALAIRALIQAVPRRVLIDGVLGLLEGLLLIRRRIRGVDGFATGDEPQSLRVGHLIDRVSRGVIVVILRILSIHAVEHAVDRRGLLHRRQSAEGLAGGDVAEAGRGHGVVSRARGLGDLGEDLGFIALAIRVVLRARGDGEDAVCRAVERDRAFLLADVGQTGRARRHGVGLVIRVVFDLEIARGRAGCGIRDVIGQISCAIDCQFARECRVARSCGAL